MQFSFLNAIHFLYPSLAHIAMNTKKYYGIRWVDFCLLLISITKIPAFVMVSMLWLCTSPTDAIDYVDTMKTRWLLLEQKKQSLIF